MFDFICGEIVSINDDHIVLKNNDIGFLLYVSSNTLSKCNLNDKVQFYTYLQVKDDGLVLYGFLTNEEKTMFLRLITVSGIGCKMAISILGGMQINDLGLAILNSDTSSLTKIKGLGKKTAERVVLELREKMVEFSNVVPQKPTVEYANVNVEETLSILRTLGLSKADAMQKIDLALNNGAKTTEEILNYALRNY